MMQWLLETGTSSLQTRKEKASKRKWMNEWIEFSLYVWPFRTCPSGGKNSCSPLYYIFELLTLQVNKILNLFTHLTFALWCMPFYNECQNTEVSKSKSGFTLHSPSINQHGATLQHLIECSVAEMSDHDCMWLGYIVVLIVSEAGRMLPASPLCVYVLAHITTVAQLTVTGCFFKLIAASCVN